jgi:hypothetical protein
VICTHSIQLAYITFLISAGREVGDGFLRIWENIIPSDPDAYLSRSHSVGFVFVWYRASGSSSVFGGLSCV